MNEEIKKEFEEKFVKPVVKQFDANNSIVLPLWKNNHSHLSSDVWEWIDQKLKERYLLGLKDMRDAVKIERERIDKHIGEMSGDAIGYEVGYNNARYKMDKQAQQFIDSLEK